MSFMEQLKDTIDDNSFSYTENGAKGYQTTGKEIIDFFYKVSSYRNMSEDQIKSDFKSVYYENSELAVKLMFFIRDCRGGLGERRLFRVCLSALVELNADLALKVLPIVPEYGRWDDLVYLLDNTNDTKITSAIYNLFVDQLSADMKNVSEKKSISLLAKWLPSINTSSKSSVQMARRIANNLKISPKNYRKTLSKLRAYLKVVERDMAGNNWGEIDYNAVPSKANLLYRGAFLRHDTQRREDYLAALASGEKNVKINSGTLYPYEIVHKYVNSCYYDFYSGRPHNPHVDTSLEEMWKALPVPSVFNSKNLICVCDGSGSMNVKIDQNTSADAHSVANSIAILLSEHLTGDYKNKFITFSESPKYVDLTRCKTLNEKIDETYKHCECANTNIFKVFKLILDTAVKNNLEQKDIPNILIVSDMEFDCGADFSKTLFKQISDIYETKGYKLPKLIFWNVNSRTNTIPLRDNKYGFCLVSGFSQSIFDMVMSDEMNPFKILLNKLNSERYEKISKIIA